MTATTGASSGEHYWTEKWNQKKFPHGPKWLTDYIKSKGLHPGIWIVPNAYAGAVEQHPDWYLRDREGKLILDYSTPALDSTNPEVLDFLKKEFTALDDWGFEYYKFDGEHALPKYVPAVDTNRLYDKSIDPIVAYRNRLKLIRETIGPERFIEGCPAGTPLNGIGYFNSYFNGEDMYGSWQGNYAMLSSINANAFLNHIVVYTMAGEGIEVAPPMTVEEAAKKRPAPVVEVARTREDPLVGFGTTLAEARTLVTYVSLTGVVYSLSSVTPELPEERAKLLKMTLPSMPILPIDLFSRGTDMPLWDLFKHTTPEYYIHNYPEILDLKVNAKSGVYDVVGLTNWRRRNGYKRAFLRGQAGTQRRFSLHCLRLLGPEAVRGFQGSDEGRDRAARYAGISASPAVESTAAHWDVPAHHRRLFNPGAGVGRIEKPPAWLVPNGAWGDLLTMGLRSPGSGCFSGTSDNERRAGNFSAP